jgi:hypothetical protein
MNFKLDKYMIIFIVLAVLMAYFQSMNQLDQTKFIALAGLMVLVFLLSQTNTSKLIDLKEARNIALNFCVEEQRANRIPRGFRLYLPEEAELKSALIAGTDEPISVGYDVIVGTELSGHMSHYYNVTITKHGNIIGVSEVPVLRAGEVKRTRPTVTIYGGRAKHYEGDVEKKKEEEKRQ